MQLWQKTVHRNMDYFITTMSIEKDMSTFFNQPHIPYVVFFYGAQKMLLKLFSDPPVM